MKLPRLLFFLAIVLVQFFLFEAGLRLAGGSEAAPVFQQLFVQDPAMGGYRLRPGAKAHFKTRDFETDIEINSAGVRGPEVPPKPASERRVVILGDSLVLAVQVEADQTFCARLERRLNDRPPADGTRFRVINAGVQGYGPVEELAFFERVVLPLEPDVVLVAVYVANDAMEAHDTGDAILPRDPNREGRLSSELTAVKRPSRWPLWLRRLTRRSMVLQIVRLRATALLERFGEARPIDRALTVYLPELPSDMAHGLAVSREAVRRMAALAAGRGAKTAVVLLPARFQVADDDYDNLRAIVAQSGATLERDLATDRFASALAPLGLPMFDALPVLRNDAERTQVFFKTTAHLTVTGHAVLAAGIESFVRSAGLVDGTKGQRP